MEDPRMRDFTHTHQEDPEEHKGAYLDEVVDPDKEEQDGRTDDRPDPAAS